MKLWPFAVWHEKRLVATLTVEGPESGALVLFTANQAFDELFGYGVGYMTAPPLDPDGNFVLSASAG